MSCNCPNAKNKQKVAAQLTFVRKELLYDAQNYVYVEGDVMGDDQQHSKHQVQDLAEDGNIDRASRVLNLAHAECVEALYPYSKADVQEGQEPLTDYLTEPEQYTIDLTLPGDFSATTLQLLEHLIHEYMVCRVVAEWMSITKPEREETWALKCAAMLAKIKSCLAGRTGLTRRPLKPF